MKSKTKFDPQVIRQFFIDHTEKFVMGLVATLFLFFTYESVTLQGYATKPDELQTRTKAAADKIVAGPATKRPDIECKFPPYTVLIDAARTIIDSGAYPMPDILYWKPIAPRRLRGTPEVFAVENTRAIPGRGALLSAQGNAGTVGQRWITVTGLVPYRKQLDEYRSKFEGAALQTADDVPRYAGFIVQRGEIAPGSKGEPNWEKTITLYPSAAIDAKFSNWSGTGEEAADPRFIHENLASRLPPLADGVWGEEVVCPPQIKLLGRDAKTQEAGRAGGALTPPPPGILRGPPRRVRGGGAPGVLDRNNPKEPGGVNAANILGGGPPPPVAVPSKDDEEQAQGPEYLLLRYFDFDVAPEKHYAYRIFLLLRNPNCGLDANVLEDAELSQSPILYIIPKTEKRDANGNISWVDTDPRFAHWSQPCTSGRGSGDMRLLGGQVVAAKGPQEINGEVRILLWLKETGRNGNFSKPGLIRGTVLNFDKAAMKIPGEGKTTQSLASNCILVDLAGGDPLPDKDRRLTSPGLILVWDEFGNLVMHDELAEAEEWEKAIKEPEKEPTHGGNGPRGPSPPKHRDDDFTRGLDRKHGH